MIKRYGKLLLVAGLAVACAEETADITKPELKQIQFGDPHGALSPVKAVLNDVITNAPASYTFIRLVFDGLLDPTTVEMLDKNGNATCVSAGNIRLFLGANASPESEIATQVCYDPSLPGAVVKPGEVDCVGFTADDQFTHGETYILRIGAGIKDAAGNPIVAAKDIKFTVAEVTEVVSTSPLFKDLDGDGQVEDDAKTDIALDTGIAIVFTDVIGDDTTGVEIIYNDGTTDRTIAYEPAPDGALLELFPYQPLLPNTRYDVRVTAAYLDAEGNSVIAKSFWFKTVPADFQVDALHGSPSANSTNQPRDLVQSSTPFGNCLGAATPAACKGGAAWYQLSDQVDEATVIAGTNVKLYKNSGEAVPGFTTEVATSDMYMAANGTTQDGDGNRYIGIRLPLDANGKTTLLERNTDYTIEFTDGIKTLARPGSPARALTPIKVTFKTAGFQVGMPFLGGRTTTPAPRSTNNAITTARVRVHFSEPVHASAADGTKVQVFKCGTTACGSAERTRVDGTWTVNADVMGANTVKDDGPDNGYFSSVEADALDFVPTVPAGSQNWDWNNKYLVVVDPGLTSATDQALSVPFEPAAFFTAVFTPSIRPPSNGAKGVATSTKVTVRFNGPVDTATVTRDSFFVREVLATDKDGKETLGSALDGTYARSSNDMIFTPASLLKPASKYRVNVSTAIRSSHGTTDAKKALSRPLTWAFWTGCL